MSIIVNSKGLAHARSLIAAGKVDKNSSWSFSAEDGNALLGADSKDWNNYSSFHIAEDTAAAENTKERYKYPFGKDGKVYHSALEAIRQRAGQQNAPELFAAAGKLIDAIDAKDNAVAAKVIFASESPDLSGASVPMEFDLLVEGAAYPKAKDINGNETSFIITANHIDSAIRQLDQRRQRAPKRDLVVDYEHQTLKGVQAPAAGWMRGLVSTIRDGKKVLRAQMREWTDRATEYLKKHEYRYVSPVFALNGRDKVTGEIFPCMILSAALTNEPLIDELQPIVATQLYQTIFGKDTGMNEVIKKLCAFLGIAESADEQTVAAKFAEFVTNAKTAIAATTEIAAKDVIKFLADAKIAIAAKADLVKVICAKDGGSIEEATAIYVAAKENAAKVVTLQTELNALKQKETDAAVDAIVAKGITEGKITPATKDAMRVFAAKDIKAFEEYLKTASVVVALGKLPEGGGTVIAGKNITEEDVAMGKKLGVTKDQLIKHNPPES